jgi:phosphatidate cytidylyltransferase
MARGQRELVAVAAIPLLVGAIVWLPAWVFLVVVGAAVTVACDELLSMARGAGFAVGRWLPLTLVTAVVILSWLYGITGLAAAVIAVLVILPTTRLADPRAPEGSLGGIAAESFSILYLGVTTACFGWLRLWPGDPTGFKLMLFYLACIWVGDSGAYYVGKNFGRRKMSPRISPNKTLEGLAGGFVTTFVAAAAMAWALGIEYAPIHIAAVAAILAVTAPLGDLVESLFKRDSGVKDSSTLLPGHGGLLDRTDSLIYPAPFVLAYLVVVGLV